MLIALATVPLYIGYIGTERYGVLAVIWALLGYFSFFDLGFGRAVTQRMARLSEADDAERSKLLWTALLSTFVLGILASTVVWIFSDYILLNKIDMSITSRSEVSGALAWMLLALPVLLPSTVMQGALQARLRFAEVNAIQLITSMISQLLPLAVAASGHVELEVLVPAALVSRILTAVLLFHQSRLHVPLVGRPMIDSDDLKALVAYGGWISVMSFLAPLLVTVDRLIIATLSGAKAVALYTVPYDLVTRAMVIPGSLSSALFPRLASTGADESRELAERATLILLAVMTPVVIAGFFLVQPFLNIWLGVELAKGSAGVGELILLGIWVNAMVIPHNARYMATCNPRTVVIIYLIQIPIYLFMLWVGIQYFGVAGAAAAWALRVVIDTTMLLRLNNALLKTLKLASGSMLLIAVAAFGITLTNLPSFVHWMIGIVLIGIALFKDRKHLIDVMQAILLRKEKNHDR
ncbi:MAG: hypothetical protein A2Z87_12595 [Gallionellales bacterium GWA2_54_124]|nr:MAG: hypothetical protein A2Z87_12595 [Gallionellales bacterium GWA2_54_124]